MEEVKKKGLTIEDLKKRHICVLSYYDILENEDKELMFTIKHESPRPEDYSPAFYYDGGEHAIFIKDDEWVFVCDHIHPGVRGTATKIVRNGEQILFAELLDGNIIDEYMVDTFWRDGVVILAEELIRLSGAGKEE